MLLLKVWNVIIFAPFIDTNPKAIEKNQKFKGVGGIDPTVFPYSTSAFALGKILKRFKQDPNYEWGLYGFHSNDGIKWTKTAKPLIAKEGLDEKAHGEIAYFND